MQPFSAEGSVVTFNPMPDQPLVNVVCVAVTPEMAKSIADAMNVQIAEKVISGEI